MNTVRQYIIAGVIVLILAIAGIFALHALEKKLTELSNTEAQKERYVEVHFGNGEIYRQEATIAVSMQGAPVATLKNGYVYRFTESYDWEFDKETGIYSVYLWRDEPYKLEKERFEKIK